MSTALATPTLAVPGIFQDFMRPFDGLLESFLSASPIASELKGKHPSIEVQDRGDHFSLTAELPGFDRKDVQVSVSGDIVELTAEKRSEEKDGPRGTKSEYSYFHRRLVLPERILSKKAGGTMKNGILELKLPRAEAKPTDSHRRVHLN